LTLDFTSKNNLLKSIRKDYSKNTQEQRDAIYEQQKHLVGKSAEKVLATAWEEYKKEHGPQQGKIIGGRNDK
jgi:hypothetical protein